MKEQAAKPGILKLLNPERQPLTVEKLRELSGLTLTDEDAERILFSIHLYAKLLYEYRRQKQDICIDNQQVVNLNRQLRQAA